MVKTLKRLCIESFFTCKKTKLYSSYYCLFSYIHVLMNRREIFFVCENEEQEICLQYIRNTKCKHCRRLQKYNLLLEKIEQQKRLKTFKLVYLVDQIVDFLLIYKKYYILPELKDKVCDLYHYELAHITVHYDHLN